MPALGAGGRRFEPCHRDHIHTFMIIDCFSFFNEYDLLEGRLTYLDDLVDKFVIVEANITYCGNSKEFNFPKQQERYLKWKDKILYYPIHFDLEKYDTKAPNFPWVIENEQRQFMTEVLKNFDKDTFVMVSDLDEIPSKSAVLNAINQLEISEEPLTFNQKLLFYGLNYTVNSEFWHGTVIAKNEFVQKVGTQSLRNNRDNLNRMNEGGWHLCYWMSAERASYKIKSFAHQEFNEEFYTNVDRLRERMSRGENIFAVETQQFEKYDASQLPKDFLVIFSKYSN